MTELEELAAVGPAQGASDPAELIRFAGSWDGPVEIAGSPGLLRVLLQPVGAETAVSGLKVTIEADPFFAIGTELGEAALTDGELVAAAGPTAIRLRRRDAALVGLLSPGYGLDPIDVELRHGHPDCVSYLVSRLGSTTQPAPPRELDDGWAVASAADVGIDGERLVRFLDAARDGLLRQVDALVVVKEGRLVVDEYFFGRGPEHLHTIQSCTKSVTSLLVGVLLDDGLLGSTDEPLWRHLPGRAGTRWIDERHPVTVHRTLAMSAGLDWNEQVPYTDPRNDAVRMNLSDDWIRYVLDRRVRPDWPADRFEYQSGLSLLLGELIREGTGRHVDDVAADRLFGPLGIDRVAWASAPDGTTHTGGGLFIRPRDFAKLGQLVLDHGCWQGRQILSSKWIDLSTRHHSSDALTDYAYQWWLPRGLGTRAIMARGFGGQTLAVLPELDTAIVTTGHDWLGNGEFPTLYVDHLLPLVGATGSS